MVKDGSGIHSRHGSPSRVWMGSHDGKEWQDLGRVFALQEPRIKEFVVCFWCQAPIYAMRTLQQQHGFAIGDIIKIRIETFEALHLNHPTTTTTGEAQYSLPFSVAAALVHGRVTGREVDGEELRNEPVLRVSRLVTMEEDSEMNAEYYNGRCVCRVTVELRDRRSFTSEDTVTQWRNVIDRDLDAKFRSIATQSLNPFRVEKLLALLRDLENVPSLAHLEDFLQV
ncbi:hypothetical protein BWQ96_04171 [Gracilariopsis chorda]|uniref:MmgE/PrpD C-terminal domain-containing protein n=1 Tax=Gracilariopsis chorda TaxID=448386 RepID=A0A2V3IVC8_9FLOR|nr:hypothetical protein BWQ96_04171 [Gracilariopsis chorda]|eukprot:PXF46071.1 hypothetical protein BWQ96_04171 [Gracilariopsis chorda]